MTEVATKPVTVPADEAQFIQTQPVLTALEPTTTCTCDGCGEGVMALFEICLPPSDKLPEGGSLTLCAHHTRKMGFEDAWLKEESRLTGSSN